MRLERGGVCLCKSNFKPYKNCSLFFLVHPVTFSTQTIKFTLARHALTKYKGRPYPVILSSCGTLGTGQRDWSQHCVRVWRNSIWTTWTCTWCTLLWHTRYIIFNDSSQIKLSVTSQVGVLESGQMKMCGYKLRLDHRNMYIHQSASPARHRLALHIITIVMPNGVKGRSVVDGIGWIIINIPVGWTRWPHKL